MISCDSFELILKLCIKWILDVILDVVPKILEDTISDTKFLSSILSLRFYVIKRGIISDYDQQRSCLTSSLRM